MPRDRLTFRQRDVTAAIKAAKAAGGEVTRVTIDKDGNIIVEMASSAANEATPDPDANPWNEVSPDDYWKTGKKNQGPR
jgi:hypothetical protein